MADKTPGQRAYEAYWQSLSTSARSVTASRWDLLGDAFKLAWNAAARAAREDPDG